MSARRLVPLVAGILLLVALGAMIAAGWAIPARWYQNNYVAAEVLPAGKVTLPPFPPLTTARPFDLLIRHYGTHFYLLGSDPIGRDMLALIARGAVPSLLLVLAVVASRAVIGTAAGVLAALGPPTARTLVRAASAWIAGFPYLALTVVVILAFGSVLQTSVEGGSGGPSAVRWAAFIVGMTAIGWRDVAEVVAERIEHVRAQPFALGAQAVGTSGLRFFRLHVLPYLRPALAIELPFQASAVLVLLAELGFLQVFLGGSFVVTDTGRGNSSVGIYTVVLQPELGQLLSDARRLIFYNETWIALAPAVAIAVAALAFELIGTGLRGRTRWG